MKMRTCIIMLLSLPTTFLLPTICVAQAPGGSGSASTGQTADDAASSKGAGLSVLFSVEKGKLSPNAALSYDFLDLGLFGTSHAVTTTKGVKPSSAGQASAAIASLIKKNTPATSTPASSLQALTVALPKVTATIAADGFFSFTPVAPGTSADVATIKSALAAGGSAGLEFDVNGNWVNADGLVSDATGKPKFTRSMKNLIAKTVTGPSTTPNNDGTSDDTGNPTTVTQYIKDKELFLTLLAGAGTNQVNSSQASSSNNTGGTVTGGFGIGLRFSLSGGNSSFFVGSWVDQFTFAQTHVAVGFTIVN